MTRLALNSWTQSPHPRSHSQPTPCSTSRVAECKCQVWMHSGLAVSRSSIGVSCRQRAGHARTSRMRATTQPPPTAPSAPSMVTAPPLPPSSSTASPRKVRHESWGTETPRKSLLVSDRDRITGQGLLWSFADCALSLRQRSFFAGEKEKL